MMNNDVLDNDRRLNSLSVRQLQSEKFSNQIICLSPKSTSSLIEHEEYAG